MFVRRNVVSNMTQWTARKDTTPWPPAHTRCDPNTPSGEGSWLLDSMFLEEMKPVFRGGHGVVLRPQRKCRRLSNTGHRGHHFIHKECTLQCHHRATQTLLVAREAPRRGFR